MNLWPTWRAFRCCSIPLGAQWVKVVLSGEGATKYWPDMDLTVRSKVPHHQATQTLPSPVLRGYE